MLVRGEGGSYVYFLCLVEVRVREGVLFICCVGERCGRELCNCAVLGRGEGDGGSFVSLRCLGELRVREGVLYLCGVWES